MKHPVSALRAMATVPAAILLPLLYTSAAQVSFNQLPRDHQIFLRNIETNLAAIPLSGTESSGGYDSVTLIIHRNSQPHSEISQPLKYRNGTANFSFNPEIPAELASYDLELFLTKNNEQTSVTQITDIAAGDAYIIYGQSNAEAKQYGSRSANEYASPWLRTFGQNGDSGDNAKNILDWFIADGDGRAEDPGSIGQWGMVLGKQLIDTCQIPIAILNGSRGGYTIVNLRKDRNDPDNLYDDDTRKRPYNRLRYRAIKAGIAESARGLFFFQGESDGDLAQRHIDGYARMRADWADDFPGIEQFYEIQIRPGCRSSQTEIVALRDAQRRFADQYPNTSIMATNGLDSHDDCHFDFTDGYENLGWNLFRQVSRDLYGAPDNPNIDPLNPLFAQFTDDSRRTIRLILRNQGATIQFPEDALADFALNGSTSAFTGKTVEYNSILFHLSEPAPQNSTLEYRGRIGPGGLLTNLYGVGMLTFSETVLPFQFLGIPANSKSSLWLGEFNRIDQNPDGSQWLLHNDHGWLYTIHQPELTGVWLWEHQQQDWFWTKASVYPLLFRHNNGNGYWLYYGGKTKKPPNRHFFDYRTNSWTTLP